MSDAPTMVYAVHNDYEWWHLADSEAELRNRVGDLLGTLGQCQDCGSWIEADDDEYADGGETPEGTRLRTATLRIVSTSTVRCECGAEKPIREKPARRVQFGHS